MTRDMVTDVGEGLPVQPLTFEERKVLLASFLVLSAEYVHLAGEAPARARELVACRDLALALAARALDRPDGQRLDLFLRDWVQRLATPELGRDVPPRVRCRHRRPRSARTAPGVDCSPLGAPLRRAVARLACTACPGAPTRLCGPRVFPRTTMRGACMAELVTLFREALDVTRAVYRWAGVPPHLLTENPVELYVTRTPRRAGGGLAGLELEGWCWFNPGPTRRGCAVVLALPVEAMSLRVMQGVPYVLLHELVAHAFQRLGEGVRGTSAADPFAEGWMDFVARLVFIRSHYHPWRWRRSHLAWRSDVHPGLELSAARRCVRVDTTASARAGYAVAERTWLALVSLRGAAGLRDFLRLSCQLNVRALDEEERRQVVEWLARGFRRSGGARPVTDALRAFAAGGGVEEFLARVRKA